MKHKKLLLILLFLIFMGNFGCKEMTTNYGYMTLDESMSGGLDFSYDQTTHTAFIGGENQVIFFREENLVDGFFDDGNFIGINLFAGRAVDDLESGSAKINDKTYNANQYLKMINGEYRNEGHFLIKVEKTSTPIEISIKWNEQMKEQKYYIVIKEGTILQDKLS